MRAALALLAVLAAAAAAPEHALALARPQVAGLQVALRAKGVYAGPIDGVAGPLTIRAVQVLQRRAGLPVDGVAGPRTRRALGRLGGPLFSRRSLAPGMRGWDVAVLQFRLRGRRLDPGPLDGSFGARTRTALQRFQHRVGLAADGIAGRATLRALAPGRLRRARAPRATHRYVVRPGDTLTAIASRHGTTVAALARANRLDIGGVLLAGARLRLPAPPPAGATAIRRALDRWSGHYGVDPRLVRALAWQESGYQPHVVSPAGAFGVMQVTPETWEFVELVLVGRPIPRTAEGNVRVGVAFLDHLLREFDGDERLALAAYYQGPRAVRRRGVLPESRVYVANVLALRSRIE